MENKTISILSTRPVNSKLLSNFDANNIHLDFISFIETKNIITEIIEQEIIEAAKKTQTIIFTSMNAAEAVIAILSAHRLQPNWNIFSLGGTTKTILTTYFTNATITANANSASTLADEIIQQQNSSAIFFCGNIRRDELPKKLQQHHIHLKEIVVYETIEITHIIKKQYDAVLFFSPSAVNSFFSVNKLSAQTIVFAIGNTTANSIKTSSSNKIIISNSPEKDMLLQTALTYFEQLKTPA